MPLLLGGQCVRFWAAGYIPKYRTETVDAPVLVTWGPYACVRNPLYLGNGLMGCGWALLAGWGWLVAFVALFALLYDFMIIPHEELFLENKFGEHYAHYRKSVPRLVPCFFSRHDDPFLVAGSPASRAFSPRQSWNMERHSLWVHVAVTLLVAARLFYSR